MTRGFIGSKVTVPDTTRRGTSSVNKNSVVSVDDIYNAKIVPSDWDKSSQHPLYTPNIGQRAANTSTFASGRTTIVDFDISADGTRLFIQTDVSIFRYTMSTAYDVSTSSLANTYNSGDYFGSLSMRGLTFNSTGTRMFVHFSTGALMQYNLGTAWDPATSTSNTVITTTNGGGGNALTCPLVWSGDGLNLYCTESAVGSPQLRQIPTNGTPYTFGLNPTTTQVDLNTAFGIADVTYSPAVAVGNTGTAIFLTTPVASERVNKSIFTVINAGAPTVNAASMYISGRFNAYDAIRGWPHGTMAALDTTYPVTAMKFANNGMYLYVASYGVGTIYRIDLAKAYSLDSYEPTSNFALLRAVQTGTGLYIKSDGTKLYATDTASDAVYQYTLSTPHDISTATLDLTKRKLMDEDGVANAITFKPDGTKMFIVGDSSNKVYEYALSTAWDISTATYTVATQSLAETTPTGITFSNTGGTMYITGETGASIYTYELATPWDISSAGVFNSTTQDSTMRSLCFGDSGSSLYAVGYENNKIYQYSFAIPYNTRSLSYVQSYTLTSILSAATKVNGYYESINISSDGTKVYLLERTSKTIYVLNLSTAWDITTATFNNQLKTVSDIELTPTAFGFNGDGTKLYVSGTTSDNIIDYELSTAWDITTARRTTTVEQFPVLYSGTTREESPFEIEFSNTGSQVYFLNTIIDRVSQLNLSTPYDVATAQLPYMYKSRRVSATWGESFINVSAGGTKMFWLNIPSASVEQYTLTTPFDVSTAVYDNIILVPNLDSQITQSITPSAIAFNSAGTRIYILNTFNVPCVFQYDLHAPWSIAYPVKADSTFLGTTSNFSNTTFAPMDTAASGLAFNDDGTQMFVVGTTADTVRTYTLRTAWDVTTAVLRRHLGTDDTTLMGAWYNNDGTKMYTLGTTNNTVYQYALGTAYDPSTAAVTTAGFQASFSVATQATGCTDLVFKSDGTAFYVVASTRIIYQYTLGTAWDISTASYSNKSYNVSARDTAITYLAFSADGTKLYVGGTTSDTISRHAMTTAWDISTASFETAQTKSVLSQDTTMQSLFFKSDGTRAFMLGSTSDRMYQYDLTTPWDITTLTYNSVSANVAHITGTGVGVSFTSDGTKLLIADSTAQVWPVTLTTAWDVSTLASDTTKSVLAQTTLATSVSFGSNGSKMYTTAANAIYEYTLNAAWKPDSAQTTVTGINPSTNVLASEILLAGIQHTPNGSTMYVTGSTLDTVHQMTLGTPWVTNTAVYPIANLHKTATLTEITGTAMRFSANGAFLYVVGTTNDTVQKYTLSTPWDISTATITQSYIVNSVNGGSVTDPACVDVSVDGYSLYVGTASTLLQYRMTTPHDLSTISAPRTLVSAQDASVSEMRFSADGTKMYVVGPTTTQRVLQTTLTQAYRPSTAGSWTSVTVTEDTSMQGLYFSDDGTKMYLLGVTNDTVYQYTLATAWDVTTASYASKSLLISGQEITATSIIFGDSGTKMYLVGTTSDNIRQYTLGTAWDISTATYASKTLSVLAQDTTSGAIFFKPDGTRVFMVGTTGDIVRGYNLGTAWDISTGVYSSALDKSILLQDTTATGLEFSSDGTKMFIIGTTNDYIYTYTLGTAWDPSTARAEHYVIGANPTSIKFNSDGTKLNVLLASPGGAIANVVTYSLSTGWEIGSIASNTIFALTTQEPRGAGFAFNNDGTKLVYLAANATANVAKTVTYQLGTAYQVNTAYGTATATLRTVFPDAAPTSIKLSTDGDKMLLLGNTTATVYGYNLASNGVTVTATSSANLVLPSTTGYRALDAIANTTIVLQTAGQIIEYYTPNSFSVTGAALARDVSLSAQDATPSGIYFKDDGLTLYMMGRTNSYVNQYTLTSPYNFGTMTYTRQFSVASQTTSATEVFFSNDGTKMYVMGSSAKTIYQYTLSTAWNISTATYTTSYLAAAIDDTGYTAIQISSDGLYIYVVSASSDNIYRFTLATPFDLSSIISTSKQTLYFGARTSNPLTLTINNTGKELFLVSTSSPVAVLRYTMSTPWDLSTATYVEQRTLASPRAFNISSDGKIATYITTTASPTQIKNILANGYSLASAGANVGGNPVLRSVIANTSGTNTTFINVKNSQYLAEGEYLLSLSEDTTTPGSNTYNQLQIRNLTVPYSPNSAFDTVRSVPVTLGNTTQLNIGGLTASSNGIFLYVVDNQRYMIYQFERI